MTKKEANKYARECAYAKAKANREGTEYIKPERPDAHTLETLSTIVTHARQDTKTLQIRMKVICEQMDVLVDFFDEVTKDNPALREYQRIAGYLLGSLIEIQERLKLI